MCDTDGFDEPDRLDLSRSHPKSTSAAAAAALVVAVAAAGTAPPARQTHALTCNGVDRVSVSVSFNTSRRVSSLCVAVISPLRLRI
ncbi:hypothetical protein KIN20_024176 [Parelaphostrongylus tenuis]|uniref:Uncharacterized protein n=1 Tax=Parelaphostrongylus tenuis TaxID=148309 RepID=A0AAD5QTG1_PARTN|nr:hypothetical protein KIN20_024176 [Parelaphostrongylus tenuis]